MLKIENRFLELLAEKRRKEKRAWSYEEIYAETGVSPGTLVRLAQQRHSMYDTKTLAALCDFFGCGIGDLLIAVNEGDDQGQQVAVATV